MRSTRTIRLSGCKKIPRSLVSIEIVEHENGSRSFQAQLKLEKMNLPPSAEVFLDAHVLNSYQRFPFGTISRVVPPDNLELADLDVGGTVQFRVKVVDNSGKRGRLLASANGIKAKDEGDAASREPLLRLLKHDLGPVPWRIEFLEDAMPGLILNKRSPGVTQLAEHDAVYQFLLLPAAIREVYNRVFSDPDFDPTADVWQGKWIRFGTMLTGRDAPDPEEEEVGNWIEAVIEKFSTEHDLVGKVLHKMEVT